MASADSQAERGAGRGFDESYNTTLSPNEELRFQIWKKKYAPNDSGDDYDLRGAFKAGLTPDDKTGHWPDTFKKPNHPTFSDQSKYAAFGKPGRWDRDNFIPAGQPSKIKPWSAVSNSKDYKDLKPEEQDEMRKIYFDQYVVPRIDPNEKDAAWEIFDKQTKTRLPPTKIGAAGFSDAMADVVRNAPWWERNLAAVGSFPRNIYEGAKQRVQQAREHFRSPTLPELVTGKKAAPVDTTGIEAQRVLEHEAPVGALTGALATTALVPGGASVAGQTLLGAGTGLLMPTMGDESVAQNTMVGGALGGGTSAVLKAAAPAVANWMARSNVAANAEGLYNSARNAVIKGFQDEGYSLPGTVVNPNSKVAKTLETVGGRQATADTAAIKNQRVVNRAANHDMSDALESIGERRLDPNRPLTPDVFERAKEAAAKHYSVMDKIEHVNWDHKYLRSMKALSMKRRGGVEPHPQQEEITAMIERQTTGDALLRSGKELRADIDILRQKARNNFAAARTNPSADLPALARAQARAAELLEELAERNLPKEGMSLDTVKNYRNARRLFAKTYDLERATNLKGDVDVSELGKMLKRGKYLEGKTKTAAQFAREFPSFARRAPSEKSAPGVYALTPYAALGLAGLVGDHFGGGPLEFAAPAAMLLARGGARSAALSRMFSPATAGNSMIPRAALAAARNSMIPRLAAAGAVSAGADQ